MLLITYKYIKNIKIVIFFKATITLIIYLRYFNMLHVHLNAEYITHILCNLCTKLTGFFHNIRVYNNLHIHLFN